MGESERKKIYQMASDSVGVTYHKLHHFLTEANWSAEKIVVNSSELTEEIRLDTLAESLPKEAYTQTSIKLEKARTVWVATIEVEISRLKGKRKIAIVRDAPLFEKADDIDYFVTNVKPSIVTSQWVVDTYSQRNWVERLKPHLVLNPRSQGLVGIERISNQRN